LALCIYVILALHSKYFLSTIEFPISSTKQQWQRRDPIELLCKSSI
jgi:hypothetical protein